jgi:hypothetical protein
MEPMLRRKEQVLDQNQALEMALDLIEASELELPSQRLSR